MQPICHESSASRSIIWLRDRPTRAHSCLTALNCAAADPDPRVRYYACEAMYNIAKVAREGFIIFFNEARMLIVIVSVSLIRAICTFCFVSLAVLSCNASQNVEVLITDRRSIEKRP